jgi:hypothetical protein
MKGIFSDLSQQFKTKVLRNVATEEKNDRSAANLKRQSSEGLEEESKHWEAFFRSGCGHWYSLFYLRLLLSCSIFLDLRLRFNNIYI